MTNSRILSRNNKGFSLEEERVVRDYPLPQNLDPRDKQWNWPHTVNNPFKYGYLVLRLHKWAGLSTKFPRGAFQRFAGKHHKLGWERLVRAAYLAAIVSKYPFSPKLIERLLYEVPGKPVQLQLF